MQGDVVGDVGVAHRSEQDRVVPAQAVQGIHGHHDTVAEIVVGAPIEFFKREGQAVQFAGPFQYAARRGRHFVANAVAGQQADGKLTHDLMLA